ncbi:MAG: SUMF1/EgtB/PvdO family nonheme iron enzyme, partial [Alphaproteobacteria bacterium]
KEIVEAMLRARLGEPLGPKVGEVFKDCPECPEMVIIPSGSFMMGSLESEEGHERDEGPVHRVSVRQPFAIGKYEVTFAEWEVCVSDGGCNGYRPCDTT